MGDCDTKLLTLWTRGSICYISVVSMDKFMLMFGCAFLDSFFPIHRDLGDNFMSVLFCFLQLSLHCTGDPGQLYSWPWCG